MPFFILIVTLFSVLFMYILIGGLPTNITCFLIVILSIRTWYRLYDTDYDTDTVQNMIDQVIQNLHSMVEVIFEIYCFFMSLFLIFLCRVSAGTDLIEQHVGHFFFFFFFEILSNSLQESDVLLFLEAIYMVSNLLYYFIEFTLLLHTFLVISFLI